MAVSLLALDECAGSPPDVTVEPVRCDPFTGRDFTFFADPDGLPLEIYEATGG